MSFAIKNLAEGALELIAFRIGNQEFCVNIMSVREIRGWTPTTAVPHSPSYMLGIVNLRGAVLPIVDLSARLGMGRSEPSSRHVIIVAQLRSRIVGLLVEAVSDILTVTSEQIQPAPEVPTEMERNFSRGILAIDQRMICLIELASLFADVESEAA